MLKQLELWKALIPCDECNEDYDNYFNNSEALSIALNSREALLRWILELHNMNNKKNNKAPWTFEEYQSYLENKFKQTNE